MKKIIASVVALALCAATLTSVSAAELNQNSTEEGATNFSFELKADPTYTVTIPETVSMEKEGSQVDLSVKDAANLDGKKISVTVAGTNYFRDQMVLENLEASGPRDSMRYQIITENGAVIETNAGAGITAVGKEIASFTEDGTKSYTVKPVVQSNNRPGVFTGSITYGISLVD